MIHQVDDSLMTSPYTQVLNEIANGLKKDLRLTSSYTWEEIDKKELVRCAYLKNTVRTCMLYMSQLLIRNLIVVVGKCIPHF